MTTVGPNAAEREINAVYNDVANNKIYFAGNFVPITSSTVYCAPGINKYRIARINSITGSLDSWNPNINNNIINGNISAICVVNNTVFLAGSIASTSLSTPFMGLLGVDANTGNIVSTFSVTGGSIKSLVYTNNLLVCAGSFNAFNGNVCNSKIAVLNLQTSSVSYNFSHPIINNPYATNYMPGYNGNVLETKIINNKIYAIAEDPNLSAHSILEVDLSTMNIKRRLSIFSNYYSFNRFTEQNDSLFIFPNPVLDNYTYQCIKIINNVDIGVPATILPANLKNWHFGFKLSQTAGVTAVFSRTIDSQWFPATIDNTNYDNYPGSLLYDYSPQTIINGNKIHIVSHNSVGGEYYKKTFYKNGNLCTEAIDDNNLNLLNQGNFILLKDFVTHGNRAFLFRKTATWSNEMSLEEFCLKPDPPLKPKAIGNYTTFCAGNTYSFVLLNPSFIKTFSWGYTGTGATIQNTNNDTVFVTFNQNATPGNVFVTGTSDCNNVKADTAFTSISFIPSPQISAKIQDTLNCYNNLQKNLFASSSSASTTVKWYAPSSPTTAVFSNSILANATGVYTTVVTQTVTGCTNTSTTNVISDTELLSILNVNPTYTAMCDPNSVLLFAQNCMSPPCYDSLYWMIGNTSYSNPLIYTPINASNDLVAKNKNIRNGCVNSFTTTVYKNTSVPSYTLNVPVLTPSVGLPEFNPITCSTDSVFLSASALNSIVFWKIPGNDTLPNNCYVDTSGVYQLIVKDTINGCINNSFLALLPTDLNPPQLSLNNSFALLNCSFNTATLQASSLSPSTSISWISPINSFTASNPATANQQGWYYAIATSASNGCKRIDSLNLIYSNTLYLNTTNDTTICYGSSVNLNANPVGGTAPFSFSWTNNQSAGNSAMYVSNTFTNVQIVQVIDNAGCIGTDTIKINVPKQLTDSVATFKSCNPDFPTGQIQVYPKGGIAPYYYSINNGLTFQSQPIFSNLNFGSYSLIIKDSLGCLRNTSATISANSFVPKIDFILNTTMMQQDTFVMVDISNPRPDSIKWTVPSNITLLNGPFVNSPILVCGDTGSFYIKAKAYFNNCIDSLTKLVRFIKYDTTAIKSGINNGIKTFSLYPNPNTGQFTVYLEFFKNQTFVIKIVTGSGSEIFQSSSYNGNSATIPVQMPVNTPGTYYLRVIAEFDSKQKSFILTN